MILCNFEKVVNSTAGTQRGINTTTATFSWQEESTVIHNATVRPATRNPDAYIVDSVVGPITIALVIVGLVGNSMSIAVMNSASFKHIPVTKVIQTLAVCDSFYLITALFQNKWFPSFVGYDIKVSSVASCRAIACTAKASVCIGNWLIAIIALERFAAIWFPIHSKRFLTVKVAYVCITIIVVTITAYNSVNIHLAWNIKNNHCRSTDQELDQKFNMYAAVLSSLTPLLLILVLNPLIIIKLCQHKRQSQSLSSTHQIAHQKVATMLLTVVIAFIVLFVPGTVAYIAAYLMGEDLFNSDYLPTVHLYIMSHIAKISMMINSSVNFFLYIVWGETFRKRLCQMLNLPLPVCVSVSVV